MNDASKSYKWIRTTRFLPLNLEVSHVLSDNLRFEVRYFVVLIMMLTSKALVKDNEKD